MIGGQVTDKDLLVGAVEKFILADASANAQPATNPSFYDAVALLDPFCRLCRLLRSWGFHSSLCSPWLPPLLSFWAGKAARRSAGKLESYCWPDANRWYAILFDVEAVNSSL